ncbi:recombinase family protein [Sphingomonas sp. S-NIH.Pt15_0812]|uniref:recombinase family protein n=1 Tax=Sphingomonas sp. S-NIH.Pt15_0812 TaxID=1920129 RepID=UPI000F7EF30C|nr:recombinase family protein [Sphingomonas sp. S-NIH.Pt15_0812]RSU50992.1 hypothetical protein BRX43_08220 [Sphingomonas sp. S-NIH.Pt15_0812]
MFVRTYLRASTAEQDATRARAALDALAVAHGFRIAARYVENEIGTRLARPKLFRLLDDCSHASGLSGWQRGPRHAPGQRWPTIWSGGAVYGDE